MYTNRSIRTLIMSPNTRNRRANILMYGSPNSPDEDRVTWKDAPYLGPSIENKTKDEYDIYYERSTAMDHKNYELIRSNLPQITNTKVKTNIERQESIRRLRSYIYQKIDNKDKNQIANLIIRDKQSYRKVKEQTDIPVKKLRSLVYQKRHFGFIHDKPGRAKLLDSTSEVNIMKECHKAATQSSQIASPEFKRAITASIKNEIFETFKRRYSQTTGKTYQKPCDKTVRRYLKYFSKQILENF